MLGALQRTDHVDEPLVGQRQPKVFYYEADGLGSVTSLTDSTGDVAATYAYDSFGKLTNSTGTIPIVPLHRAQSDPDTGLYYYRARYYDPSIGKFISEDPIGFEGSGPNFYAYVRNNPIVYRDPTGLCYTATDKGLLIVSCLAGMDPSFLDPIGPEKPQDSTDSPDPVGGQRNLPGPRGPLNPGGAGSPGPDGGALGAQIANCIAKVLALPPCDGSKKCDAKPVPSHQPTPFVPLIPSH